VINVDTQEMREEVLSRLLTRALVLHQDSTRHLKADEGARLHASNVEEFVEDCREYMVAVMTKKWAPGEAPPGIERLQDEVKEKQGELEKVERRKARNKSKAAGNSTSKGQRRC
jgi:hypothetical protein